MNYLEKIIDVIDVIDTTLTNTQHPQIQHEQQMCCGDE